MKTGRPARAPRVRLGAQPAVGRDTTRDADAAGAQPRAASNVRSISASTTTRWKLAAMSAIRAGSAPSARRRPRACTPRRALAHEPQHRGLEPVKLKSSR